MASIRRTLSPYRNGGNTSPFSPNSPTKLNSTTTRFASPLSDFSVGVRRFIGAEKHIMISSNNPKKGGLFRTWRKSIFGYFLFFLVGFLLGLAPFGELEQKVQSHNFSFELNGGGQVLDVKQDIDHVAIDEVEKIDNVNLNLNNVNVNVKERFDYDVDKKQVIIVTPTYGRALQALYLNRLGQVLRLVPPPLLWIVVEMNVATAETADILRGMGIMYRHLVCSKNVTDIKDRGVHQRNRALEHIEHHKLDGIVYFADDDNIYSLELFESLRNISRFGTWPVAMLAQSKNKATLEGPVCNGSQVIGWHTNEKSKRLRRFHVDMSGFAFNSTILWDPKRWKKPTSALIRQLDTIKEGFQETTFIEQLVEDESQMEATPFGCSKIMNWHLHLEAHDLGYPRGWLLQKNLDALLPIE